MISSAALQKREECDFHLPLYGSYILLPSVSLGKNNWRETFAPLFALPWGRGY